MRHRAAALWALLGVWTAWAFAPLLGGYFLSDDFVPLALFGLWQEQGRFAAAVVQKFASGLDSGENNFYRPLAYASFALNFVTSGIAAGPWMAVNVATHVANAMLVAVVAMQLTAGQDRERALAAAAVGAALFLFYAPSAEVVAWVSGRYDGFATLFTLLACALFLRSRRTWDAAWLGSLACAMTAMLAKESAAIVPFAILFLAWFRAEPGTAPLARAGAALRAVLPWIALALAYLAWRRYMFGSALRVYENTRPLVTLLAPDYWRGLLESLPVWYAQQFRSATWFAVLCALTVAQPVIAAAGWPREQRARDALIASAAIFALTLLLLAPHVGVLRPDGLGGRLLYQSAAFFAIFAAVALAVTRWQRTLWATTLALAILGAALQAPVLARWLHAHHQMRALVADVARIHRETAPGGYTLVLAPISLDDIPFAGNAQAGIMLPPVQREALSHRLLVQTYKDLPLLAHPISLGLITKMRSRSLLDLDREPRTAPLEYPTAAVCWDSGKKRFVSLGMLPGPTPEEWVKATQRALARSSCAERPAVPGSAIKPTAP